MPKYYTFEDKSFYQGFRDAPFALVFIFFCQGKFCLTARADESLSFMNFILLRSVNANTKNFPASIKQKSFILMLKCYIIEDRNF